MTTLQELARLVGGTVEGDGGVVIHRLAPIDQAGEGDLTFVANAKYLPLLQQTQASAVIVALEAEGHGRNLLRCANPYLAFARILAFLQQSLRPEPGIRPGAQVDASALLESGVTIFPGVYVGPRARIGQGTILHPGVVVYEDAVIGADCLLYANAVVRERCRLGDRVILQPGAVIGSDGFGYAPDGTGYLKIPQVGIVVLEDDVEIGACTCVDRAALEVTRIRRGSKLDNMVQIAHNVDIGEDCIITAQVGIAGSSRIGRHCTFGGQSGVAGHVKVGDQVMVGGRGAIAADTGSNQILSGAPAIAHRQWLKASTVFARLPELEREVRHLKKQLEEIQTQGRD